MSTRRSIPLGPFDLLRPVERGGMSAVWRAVHRARHTSVAIKAVTAPIGREHDFRAWFAGEVRAVARLDHPTIVRVHDHGEISAEVADATGGRLPEGAPYMVMEWLGGGPLRRRRALMDWPQVRRILLALLDALAHAHARGVVHRDLKTDNILLADRGPVLSDFGLAFTLRPD
ncbi:MAG: protein kinase, partial [Myxococcales bacterium]|nr:protein kinase [Myxococcales bacterium]